jgi:hypothetical protein
MIEDPMENNESFSRPPLVHLMLQGKASNTSNWFFSEAGKASTLAYNKTVQHLRYFDTPTLTVSRHVQRNPINLASRGHCCIGPRLTYNKDFCSRVV